jgi:hypothetical protein
MRVAGGRGMEVDWRHFEGRGQLFLVKLFSK